VLGWREAGCVGVICGLLALGSPRQTVLALRGREIADYRGPVQRVNMTNSYASQESYPTYRSAPSHFSDLEYERYHGAYGSHTSDGTEHSAATEFHRSDHDAVARDAYLHGGYRYGGMQEGYSGQVARSNCGAVTTHATYTSAPSHFSDLEYERYHGAYGSHSPDGTEHSAATEFHRSDHDAVARDAYRYGEWGRYGQSSRGIR
jgi:hypothetical protein